MATTPTTPACWIDDTGIHCPDYQAWVTYYQNLYYSIYGADCSLDPDDQDGEWIAAKAQADYDVNQAIVAAYNSLSPATAFGAGLASIVKINGLTKNVATNSEVTVTLGGTAGIRIINGVVGDEQGKNSWNLPPLVVMPPSGSIDVTAVCSVVGTVLASPGTVTKIVSGRIVGWQSVTNVGTANPGAAIETDAALRLRQARSTGLSAITPVDAIYAAIANIAGVQRLSIHENDQDATDSQGVPGHSLAIVVEGGDSTLICNAIALKKTPGTGTVGNVSQIVVDAKGVPNLISFYQVAEVPITVEVDIEVFTGYVSGTVDPEIKAAINALLNTNPIGTNAYLTRVSTAANLDNTALDSALFVVNAVRLARGVAVPAAANVPIAFNEVTACDNAHITITVVP